jgi:hypothetical protein
MFFHTCDDWVITHVFEPIAWWSEYHFGIGGLRIYLYLYMVVFTAFSMVAYYQGQHLLMFVDMGLVFFQIQTFPLQEEFLRRNKGLNRNKTYWRVRIAVCVFVSTMIATELLVATTRLPLDWLTDFLLCVLMVAMYFGSCNALPPGYEERKLVLRTT